MANRLEQLLADSLQDRADAGSPIDPVPVLHAAAAQGRRVRLRRQAAGGVLATVIAGTSIYGVTIVHRATPVVGPSPSSSSYPFPPREDVNLALLPPAATDGAITRPDLVGSDPRTVHFAVDAMAGKSMRASYHVTSAYESANIQRRDYQAYVAVSQDPKTLPPSESFLGYPRVKLDAPVAVRVGDLPATLTVGRSGPLPGRTQQPDAAVIWSLIWQPATGLWANVQVQTTSLERALQIAGQVRFDQARRCALPFRLETPAGSVVAECEVSLYADHGHIFGYGGLTFREGAGTLVMRASNNWYRAGVYPRSLRAGKYLVDKDPTTPHWTMVVDDLFFTAIEGGKPRTYDQHQVLRAFSTVEPARGVEDPASWY